MSTVQRQAPTYQELVQGLADRGLLDRGWRQAWEAVPRMHFIPETAWRQLPDRCEPVSGTDDRLTLVHSDEPVVTQLDDGAEAGPGIATSSNSQPSMVARMLGLLQVEDGHRVLEIGTGTGHVAALLSERLGDEQVYSIELDPALARQAADAIAGAGYRPHLRIGDGEYPWPGMSPVDRLIATCALRYIPHALVRQVRPGGIIVAPLIRDFWSGALVQLHVQEDGTAVGTFTGGASYMPMRSHRPAAHQVEGKGRRRSAGLDPAQILDIGFALYAGARLPGVRVTHKDTPDGAQVWASREDGAAAIAVTGEDVWQYGPGLLWEEIEQAWWEYEGLGRPGPDQFGMTATHRAQQVWLRNPHTVIEPTRP
ncbi:methyltransferase domain-containing protein [Streptomyces sp. BE308]|uniref:methyltransferase domain-containing protein n=1 Tax=Streptomyces sp. BE308 TaxID=3002529 RepID=UPI002E77DE21|nr:methyltransferase domain-containing protein [Streptomyces sp. BE308]MEE1796833.1 methyltransferase domain-containing protein [Streptomyces sp. BE308]